MRTRRDQKLSIVLEKSAALQRINFPHQHRRIDDHSVGDDARLSGVQNPGGNQVQDGPLASDDKGVAGVVPALKADHHLRVFGEKVDDLSLPLVAPLGSYDHDIRHSIAPSRSLYRSGARMAAVLIATVHFGAPIQGSARPLAAEILSLIHI